MAPFKLHVCYGLALILNHCACLRIREIPEQNRARRYDPYSTAADPEPYHQDPDWLMAAKRPSDAEAYQKDENQFLDLLNLRDLLKLRLDEYDDEEATPEDNPAEPEATVEPREDQSVGVEASEENEATPGGDPDNLRYRVLLDTKGDFKLQWDIDDVLEVVYFRLVAKVAKNDLLMFGFSDYGEITSADLMVMWTNQTGHHVIQVSRTMRMKEITYNLTRNTSKF